MPRRHHDNAPTNLEILPVMNLVSILIPFLLLSAQFVQLAVIDVPIPAICGGTGCQDDDVAPATPPLDLHVIVHTEGIKVLGRGIDARFPCARTPCLELADYAFEPLNDHLARIKDAWPDEEGVTIVPADATRYDVIVALMDATRESRRPSEKGRVLFPFVVVGAPQ